MIAEALSWIFKMNIWCVLMLITNPRVSNCALVCVHFCLVVQPSLHLEDDDALFGHNMAVRSMLLVCIAMQLCSSTVKVK